MLVLACMHAPTHSYRSSYQKVMLQLLNLISHIIHTTKNRLHEFENPTSARKKIPFPTTIHSLRFYCYDFNTCSYHLTRPLLIHFFLLPCSIEIKISPSSMPVISDQQNIFGLLYSTWKLYDVYYKFNISRLRWPTILKYGAVCKFQKVKTD